MAVVNLLDSTVTPIHFQTGSVFVLVLSKINSVYDCEEIGEVLFEDFGISDRVSGDNGVGIFNSELLIAMDGKILVSQFHRDEILEEAMQSLRNISKQFFIFDCSQNVFNQVEWIDFARSLINPHNDFQIEIIEFEE